MAPFADDASKRAVAGVGKVVERGSGLAAADLHHRVDGVLLEGLDLPTPEEFLDPRHRRECRQRGVVTDRAADQLFTALLREPGGSDWLIEPIDCTESPVAR